MGLSFLLDMKLYDRIRVDQWFLAMVGVLLLALSLLGVWHGARASLASYWSLESQFGESRDDVDKVLEQCQRAFVLYPWNYYFSIYAAELAYYKIDEAQGELRTKRFQQAQLWCERGLMQNGFRSQLRRLQTRILWDRSPSEAIAYWEAHTKWQFWEPYNHETLAGLYAKYGDFEKANHELKLIEGFPAYEATRTLIESEKKYWAE